ncbi:MFS transporter [Streptomyces abyssalis]|uniref:MFS transporter n=2 Tax=Streptomyces abyssalis TaxID=933944 RepID=A0A1E7JNE4_9ACTN|nr:MFS transporter [Streptomyces abyssalis]OEU89764.1 MFS transporter [Streptomyces abyssalis]
MSRIAVASLVGTTIEFYDFFIYGTAAALVFESVFFPALGTAAGTAAALATFGVAFVARPFGSVLFGHFGDRLGRKKTLVSTLLLMGLATVAVGLLPSTESIGAAAPVLLIALRICQGVAVGGEWAGATLLTAENAPREKRGFYALFPQLGPSLAFMLSSATFLVITLSMSKASFAAWGWRIPFLISIVLVVVGLYVRLRIEESAVFTATAVDRRSDRLPIAAALTRQPREILFGAGAVVMTFAFFYVSMTYLTTYGVEKLGLSLSTVLSIGIVAGLAFAVTTVIGSVCSDRFGRRKVIMTANALAVPVALALFPILDLGTPTAFAVGMCLPLAVVGLGYGPAGALLPEIFSTRHRYTGAGIAYNLAGVLGGAVTPLVSSQLAVSFGGSAMGFYLAAIGLVSLLSILALRESKDNALEGTALREAATAPAST